jgi:hypothetical protein
MPGLWKAWKAKSRLPTLSTSPLEISPQAGEISTFPQRRRRRRMEKWKTKNRFSTFPPPRILPLQHRTQTPRTGFAPARQGASRLAIGPDSTSWPDRSRPSGAADQRQTNERRHRAAAQFSGSLRIGIEEPFQAHLVLELILDFRLICGLENAEGFPAYPPLVGCRSR